MNAPLIDIAPAALHERVTARLRQMLVEGVIAPGAKLNERELAEVLQVSRTPLREAIRMLAAEGLVELLPNRGAVALQLSEADVLHTFEVMAGLEGMSGELAAQRISDAELAEIRAMHYEMMACHARRDLSGYYAINSRIHAAINAAARNPVLQACYAQVNARVQALRFRSNQDEQKWARALKEHEQMVDALSRRDGAGLRKLLMLHLQHKQEVVIEQLRLAAAPTPSFPRTRESSATPPVDSRVRGNDGGQAAKRGTVRMIGAKP
jgi:DNA-binding GntR family transcriptional regulator